MYNLHGRSSFLTIKNYVRSQNVFFIFNLNRIGERRKKELLHYYIIILYYYKPFPTKIQRLRSHFVNIVNNTVVTTELVAVYVWYCFQCTN